MLRRMPALARAAGRVRPVATRVHAHQPFRMLSCISTRATRCSASPPGHHARALCAVQAACTDPYHIDRASMSLAPTPRNFTLRDVMRHSVRYYPDETAIVSEHDGAKLTYTELDERSTRLANVLIDDCGVKQNGRVAIASPNTFRFVETYLANAKAGTTTAAIAYMLQPDEMLTVIDNTEAETLLVHPVVQYKIDSIKHKLKHVKRIIRMQDGNGEDDYEQLLSRASASLPSVDISESDIAALFLTSGTTGTPKAVMKSHRSLSAMLSGVPIRPGDSMVVYNNYAWIGATGATIGTLSVGGTVVIHDGYDFDKLVDDVEKYSVPLLFMLPGAAQDLAYAPSSVFERLAKSVKMILYGAGIFPKIMKAMPKTAFFQAYAQTESGMLTALQPWDHPKDPHNPTEKELQRISSCGRIASWMADVKVVDEDFNEVAAGENGEIVCRSDGNMTGYLNNAQATAEAIRDGWLRTGDAGYFDEDGYLYIRSRVKDMIPHPTGVLVFPREIEDILLPLPQLKDVTVIGKETPGEVAEKVVVCAVLHEGKSISEDEIIEFCRERLAEYKVPEGVVFFDKLPYNANGKVMKRLLQEEEEVVRRFGTRRLHLEHGS